MFPYFLLLFNVFTLLERVAHAQLFTPTATLYAGFGATGKFLRITENQVSDLSSLSFNNLANSACLRGTWLFYENEGFSGGMEYVFDSKETCHNFQEIRGFVSSVRSVGDYGDYRADSITFYSGIYFQNQEEFGVNDLPHLSLYGVISSFIITGSSHWTVYDEPNFEGRGICIQISPTTPLYTPGFIGDTSQVVPSIPHGTIASVRKGCHAGKVFKPPPIQPNIRNESVPTQ